MLDSTAMLNAIVDVTRNNNLTEFELGVTHSGYQYKSV